MKYTIFEYLNLSIDSGNKKSAEKVFFNEYSSYLSTSSSTKKYLNIDNCFDYIKADVVIQGLINKEKIESVSSLLLNYKIEDSTINLIHEKLPYFLNNNQKIYIPFFSPKLNDRYDTKIEQLSKDPFIGLRTEKGIDNFFVDPFLTYKNDLINSNFTSLLKVMTHNNFTVYYSYSFSQIYIISEQGTLDCSIPIFDSDLIYPNRNNIPERIIELMNYYFTFDKQGFINALKNLGFISTKLYQRLVKISLK